MNGPSWFHRFSITRLGRGWLVGANFASQCGGDIAESSGDGLMVLFHDADHQRHAERAVEAVIRIFDETDRWNADSAHPPIALHMGINSGVAHVGSSRNQGQTGTRWVFTADGFVVNLASRIANVAQGGELCLGPDTARRVKHLWELEDLGPKATNG